MFRKKKIEIPETLKEVCNYELTPDDWLLISEAFVMACQNELQYQGFLKSRNKKKFKQLWRLFEKGKSDTGHVLIGVMFLHHEPDMKKKVCPK